ncbi:MAG TPA: outer membrane beta-barrel protein, partial [Flavipsychrobacter sp.]|nr:outer membrane beta-barrel protein [Flavipsychrobacter sp.]
HEYSPRVYCHEVLHLCGLPDRYRECRDPWRKFNDNCKDGDTCKTAQLGTTPACPGFEHDCMGTDVTKSISCESNIMAFVRMANDATFVCDEECCKKKEEEKTRTSMDDPKTNFGLVVDGGLAVYNQKNETYKDDKLRLYGLNFALGGYADFALMQYLWVMTYVKLNLNMVSAKRTEQVGNYSNEDHYAYRFMDLSLGSNARYYLMQRLALFAGPEVAFILMAREKQYGTSTYNGMSTAYGENKFQNISQDRKIQLGFNLGVMYQWVLMQRALNPYFNLYFPLTNYIAFNNLKNKLFNINLGVAIPLR